ncbi:MAG: Rne/Rng family ribonuclease [Pseudomonadota bacterium]
MTKRMLIDAAQEEEVRVALVDGNKLTEYDFESQARQQLKGNIYLARITRVEPSLQAAFVEYGGNRHGFLAFSEIHPDYYQIPIADRQALLEDVALEGEDLDDLDLDDGEIIDQDPDDNLVDEADDADDSDADDETDADGDAEDDDAAADDITDSDDTDSDDPDLDDDGKTIAHSIESDDEDAVIESDVATADSDEATDEAADKPKPRRRRSRSKAAKTTDEAETASAATAASDGDSEMSAKAKPKRGKKAKDSATAKDEAADSDGAAEDQTADQADTADSVVADSDASDSAEADEADTAEDATEETTEARGDDEDNNDSDDDHDNRRRGRRRGRGRGRRRGGRGSRSADAEGRDGADDDDSDDDDDFERKEREQKRRRTQRLLRKYKIQEVIKRRQIMLVQVAKEERGSKGAALTTYLSLAGRYCVLMPNSPRGGGVSRKITNFKDRKRMKDLIASLEVPEGMSVILRTAGVERTKAEIRRDLDYLLRQWDSIRELTLKSQAPALIYQEGDLIKRAMRDMYTRDIDEVMISGENGYRNAKDFMKMLMPSHARRIQQYKDDMPIFSRYQVESQINDIHEPIVQLRSGGYLVINPTEALVSIDINSGRATKERHIEETALRTNLEAAAEIGRQVRLRDLAGLVVIDFIDMEENRNNAAVERKMKEAMRGDRARVQLGRISNFGLLEFSRQRLRPSLIETSFEPCVYSQGTGFQRTVESSALQVLRMAQEEAIRTKTDALEIAVERAVALYLLNQKRRQLIALEDRFGVSLNVVVDEDLIRPACRIERVKSDDQQGSRYRPVSASRSNAAFDEESDEDDGDNRRRRGRGRGRGRGRNRDRDRDDDQQRDDRHEASDEDGEDGGRRRRRRRRGRRGRRYESDGESHEETIIDNEDGDTATDGGDTENRDTAGHDDDDEGGNRRRRRGRRGGRRRGGRQHQDDAVAAESDTADDEGAADSTDTGDNGSDVTAAPADSEGAGDGDDEPKPAKRSRSRRKPKEAAADASTSDAVSEPNTTDEATSAPKVEEKADKASETPKKAASKADEKREPGPGETVVMVGADATSTTEAAPKKSRAGWWKKVVSAGDE